MGAELRLYFAMKLFTVLETSLETSLVFLLVFSFFMFTEPNTFPVSYTATNLFDTPKTEASMYSSATRPLLLSIPRIGVRATVQAVSLSPDSDEMAPPSNFTDVAWYQDGVVPGALGSAVIAGHLNGRNVPQAVFYNLDTLVPGDNLFITDQDGTSLTFVVVGIKKFAYDDPTDEVFIGDSTRANLNLITCDGAWLSEISRYDTRTVIFSELVK